MADWIRFFLRWRFEVDWILRWQSESTIVSEGFKGGTRGAPIMPRDVSLSDSKCWNGGHEWVKKSATHKKLHKKGWLLFSFEINYPPIDLLERAAPILECMYILYTYIYIYVLNICYYM